MPLVEISMNKSRWDALPADIQAAFESTVKAFSRRQVTALAEKDGEAVAKARAGGKITVHDWSADERARFRSIAMGEWEKVAARSENARKVYTKLTGYLKSNGLLK
jgi:TRAP-type C4-dicarboxylate transport system substrate-binding protein